MSDNKPLDCTHDPVYPEWAEYYDPKIMSLDGVFISGLGDVVIPVKHFGLFPWEKFNVLDSNLSTIRSGGHPLRDNEWTLCFWLTNSNGDSHPLLKQYRWCIPEGLFDLLEWCRKRGIDDLQSKLKNLLDL